MNIEIREIRKKDFRKAIEFAITGMHFDWYFDHTWLLKLYGTYFWYLEIGRATQIIAAYYENKLAGVLLAEIKGEERRYTSLWGSLYVRIFDFIQKIFYQDSAGTYEDVNRELLAEYLEKNRPDGEILFLAANPNYMGQGIGSKLLEELERRTSGKTIYLFTDDACTYPFYERRGFHRCCERKIVLKLAVKEIPLKCFLYSKTVG